MRITIDTREDHVEDVRHAVAMLRNWLESRGIQLPSTPAQAMSGSLIQQPTQAAPILDMFGSQSPCQNEPLPQDQTPSLFSLFNQESDAPAAAPATSSPVSEIDSILESQNTSVPEVSHEYQILETY
ncbi:MAG TPA: hypothetical protein VJI75_00585 [Candidatus Nanoarchaeia archaeon]|nr:hypothetical protein [Candidatus Nanoarchaeia archaeon]